MAPAQIARGDQRLAEGETLEEATFRGNVIGAIQITHRSDNEGLPTREQLSKIILEGTA